MSEAVFAAYLLGYDTAQEEQISALSIVKADLADDDKLADKASVFELRFDVPPSEAIDYFRRKQIVTKKAFDKLSRQAKAGAFYISGVYQDDVLAAFQQLITDALKSGHSQKYVVDNFKSILDGVRHRELGNFHLESIFRSNMQTAYGVGRRRQMEESADLLPFWEYSAVNDDRTRPTHRALDGIIFPANHDFWDTHYCPWDFNCRCTIIARVDMPGDYNHSQPNADTIIAFDKKGLPAKAEYLNKVVDLKATTFAGVPRGLELDEVLKQTAQKTKDKRDAKKNRTKKQP